jgi:hypothetical protein
VPTLLIRKTGGTAKRALTFGGEGDWVVTDGDRELATARSRTLAHQLDIEIDGRRLSAEMPGMYSPAPENEFTVHDEASGDRVVDGRRIVDDHTGQVREKWSVRFTGGAELLWMYKLDPPEMGFYDLAGSRVMGIGHHVPFDPSSKRGTFRILLHLWSSAAKSTEQYAADFEEHAIGPVVPAADVPLLAVLGMWLERRWDVKGRGDYS